jgi:hypothetical protein
MPLDGIEFVTPHSFLYGSRHTSVSLKGWTRIFAVWWQVTRSLT